MRRGIGTGGALQFPCIAPTWPLCSAFSFSLTRGWHGPRTFEFARRSTVRRDFATRPVVVAAAGRTSGAVGVHRLRDLGGLPRKPLHLRAVSVAVLLARSV